jgi:hypothetical protein
MKGYDPTASRNRKADHFVKCPGCGEWFDMRDLAQVLGHVPPPEVEGLIQKLHELVVVREQRLRR